MTTSARLELQLSIADELLISRAASLRGIPMAAFARDAALREAEKVMSTDLTVSLSVDESRRLLAALDAPFTPNARMGQAIARHRR